MSKEKTNEQKMGALVKKVQEWGRAKGLDKADPHKQYLKVGEEFGEIGAALARDDHAELIDAIGDTIITLILLADQSGTSARHCLAVAYDEIKDRTGEMKNGVFVKDSDLAKNGFSSIADIVINDRITNSDDLGEPKK